MAILYQLPNLNPANVFVMASWDLTAKFNSRQYFRLYGMMCMYVFTDRNIQDQSAVSIAPNTTSSGHADNQVSLIWCIMKIVQEAHGILATEIHWSWSGLHNRERRGWREEESTYRGISWKQTIETVYRLACDLSTYMSFIGLSNWSNHDRVYVLVCSGVSYVNGGTCWSETQEWGY